MDNNIFVLKEKAFAIEINEKKKLVYFYHLIDKEIENKTKSVLLTIDSESMNEINQHFNIDIQKYGVVVDDAPRKQISKEDKKEIGKEGNFTKYLMIFFFFVTLIMLNSDFSEIDRINNGLDILGYIVLFVISLVLIVISGKEYHLKDRLAIKLKYNITTKRLPTKKEQIEILESKIDTLLEERSTDVK